MGAHAEEMFRVTSPDVRPFVRSIVERFSTQTSVLSQSEIPPPRG